MSEIGESKYTSVCISVRNMAMWKCQKNELKLLKKVGIGSHGKMVGLERDFIVRLLDNLTFKLCAFITLSKIF